MTRRERNLNNEVIASYFRKLSEISCIESRSFTWHDIATWMLLVKNSYDSLSIISFSFLRLPTDSLPALIVIISKIVYLAASEIFALSINCVVLKNTRDLWTFGNSLPERIHIKISERNANPIAIRRQVFRFRFFGHFERSLLMIRANLSRKRPLEKFERSYSGSSYVIK